MLNKNKSKNELAEIALRLYKNVDEAEQFSDYIPELIRHCDKAFLIKLIKSLKSSVEDNLEYYRSDTIVDDPDELREFLEKI